MPALSRLVPALLLIGLAAAPHAQSTRLAEPCVLRVPLPRQASEAERGHQAPIDGLHLRSLPRTATFDVTYSGFTSEAQAAFQAAVDVWERHVASDVPIRVDAVWADLGEGLLGSAGPRLLLYSSDAPGDLEPNVWYPYALADAILGEDVQDGPAEFDVSATFNSDFDRWHFDTSTPAPSNRFDLFTVVLHELGHGLGFIGTGEVSNGQGEIGQPGLSGVFPYAYDLLVVDESGISLLDAGYPNPSAALAEALTSEALFVDGSATVQAFGSPAPIYAPPSYLPGSSYSHLDEDTFTRGDPDALMTPFLASGERIPEPRAVTCGIFADMGWSLGAACTQAVSVEEQAPLRTSRLSVFPNPSARMGCAAVRGREGEPVRVSVFDVQGRLLSETEHTTDAAGAVSCAPLPMLPAGLYIVRSEGAGAVETASWTVVR